MLALALVLLMLLLLLSFELVLLSVTTSPPWCGVHRRRRRCRLPGRGTDLDL